VLPHVLGSCFLTSFACVAFLAFFPQDPYVMGVRFDLLSFFYGALLEQTEPFLS